MLLDVITEGPQWEAWSAEQLPSCLLAGAVAIIPLIFGEVAFAYEGIEAVEGGDKPFLFRHSLGFRP